MEPPDSEESSGSGNFVHHPLMAMQAGSCVFVTLSCLAGLDGPSQQQHRRRSLRRDKVRSPARRFFPWRIGGRTTGTYSMEWTYRRSATARRGASLWPHRGYVEGRRRRAAYRGRQRRAVREVRPVPADAQRTSGSGLRFQGSAGGDRRGKAGTARSRDASSSPETPPPVTTGRPAPTSSLNE
jgi:hypothetical protein